MKNASIERSESKRGESQSGWAGVPRRHDDDNRIVVKADGLLDPPEDETTQSWLDQVAAIVSSNVP